MEKLIAQVKDKPSEADLQALFDKYKDQEYAPDKDTPGFKQPRRMRLEWISASPDSEYYRKQARAWLLSLVAATPGNALLPMALIDPLVSEYESLKWGKFRAPALTVENFASSFYDYIYFGRPENVACGSRGSARRPQRGRTRSAWDCRSARRAPASAAPVPMMAAAARCTDCAARRSRRRA